MAVETMAQVLYADLDDLRTVVREETLIRCLDWDGDGVVDEAAALAVCLEPASADIDKALQTAAGVYPQAFSPPFPPALKYIALDGCMWRLSAKYPRVYEVDVAALQAKVERDLTGIRKGQLSLGKAPPEPNSVHGGATFPRVGGVLKGPIFSNGGTGKWGIF